MVSVQEAGAAMASGPVAGGSTGGALPDRDGAAGGPGPALGRLASGAVVEIPPLTIRAFMVTRDDLLTVLRLYLPHLADVEAIDRDRFLLTVGDTHPGATGGR